MAVNRAVVRPSAASRVKKMKRAREWLGPHLVERVGLALGRLGQVLGGEGLEGRARRHLPLEQHDLVAVLDLHVDEAATAALGLAALGLGLVVLAFTL